MATRQKTTNDFSQLEITSDFNSLPIKVFIKPGNPKSRTAIVLNSGAFEPIWGDGGRYKRLLLWMQKHLAAHPHVISYETAHFPIPQPNLVRDDTFWPKMQAYWKEAYKGKEFSDELNDVRKIYQSLLSGSLEIEVEAIYVIGFSVGGTLAMILANEFPQLKMLCTLGSAVSTKRHNLPVLSGYWEKNKILNSLTDFSASLKMLQGYNEQIVPFHDAVEVLDIIKKAKSVSLTRVEGADHMFWGSSPRIFGKKNIFLKN